ncbi:MAG: autotransporter-associated beta strand repeat-containing protein, partial [Kiritimatiellae bacterium]|nr:autotransporter-associated beta strand repeat-containing protein [Kiritimatiellia bacterium]
NAKWFSRNEAGFNGNATIGRVRSFKDASGYPTTVELPVEATAGETLTIGKLTGGRGPGSAVIKASEGALEIGDATSYGGTVKLEAGSLAFTRRELPTALPHDAFIHFDPSDSSSFVTNASGEFLLFRNLAIHNGWKMNEICARPAGTAPTVLKDEMGTGLHMLDFGDYVQSDFTRMLYFATNETGTVTSFKATPSGFTTVIAVVGAQRGGGGLIKQTGNLGYLCRNSTLPCRFDTIFFGTYSVVNNLPANLYATAMIDAIPADGTKVGFDTPAYQVVALQGPGNTESDAIGGTAWGSGGLRLGEIAIYRRVLSQQELRDASAYLMKKWLNREAPGYARFKNRQTPDVLTVSASGSASLDVNSGSARIGTITAPDGSFVKEGAGTLELFKTDAEHISVRGGKVVKVATPDVSSACELAAEPALHLDVTDASSMRVTEVNGERRVYEWYSQGDRTVMATIPHRMLNDATQYGNDKYAPYLSSAVQLNGRDTLDFGPFTIDAGGRAMSLSRSFDAVRSAYVVWAPRDDSRGSFFGCSKGNGDTVGELYDFLRDATATNTAALLQGNPTSGHVSDGQIYTNGIQVAATMIVPSAGRFMLAEFHPTCPAHISGLGTDRDVPRFTGGIRMAEVVLYERELSDREKVATRNYLMQKWFNAAPQALPEPEEDTMSVYDIEVAGSGSVGSDADISAWKLRGSGTFVKDGEGTLSVSDLSEFSGEVVVTGGTLKITGIRPASDAPFAAADDLLFHADATRGFTTVTNENGMIEVTEWASTLNDGWSAIPFHDANRPTLIKADDLNRGYVVDMGASGKKQAMRFAKNGVTNLLESIGSVFWMLGSHNGGGYLLGGGHHYSNWAGGLFNFMRGGPGGRCDLPEYSILNSAWVCPYNLQSAEWRLDGTSVSPLATGLSGGWDLISMNITNVAYQTSNADGFAFDGRTINNTNDYVTYMGCQRLAEVLIYNRKLTDGECVATENYLRRKWGYKGTQMSMTNAASVSVAAGAALDLGGTNQYVAAISGAGTVTNGTLAIGTLVADPTLASLPEFKDVTVAIEAGQKVTVANAGTITRNTVITILACESITGLENLETAIIAGVPDDRFTVKLVFENGVLGVKFLPKGLIFQIR